MHHRLIKIVAALVATLAFMPLPADVLKDAQERGTLRVGVSLFTPWTMQDEDGNLKGFEVDVTRKLAQDMNVTAEYRVYEWESIIPALQGGEIDVIAAGMAITPDRALKVNFSKPYDEWGATLVTNTEKTSDIQSLAELNRPATVLATVSETFAANSAGQLFDKADLRVFKTAQEAEKAVLSGEAHAYLVSGPEAYFLAMQNPGVVDLPLAEPLVESRAAFGVAKGDQEWLNFLNAWIEANEANKWIETSRHYWFRTTKWRTPKGSE